MTATTEQQCMLTTGPLDEPARRLRDPLAEVVSRCSVLDEAARVLADRLADDPAVLLMLINAHLARMSRSSAA